LKGDGGDGDGGLDAEREGDGGDEGAEEGAAEAGCVEKRAEGHGCDCRVGVQRLR